MRPRVNIAPGEMSTLVAVICLCLPIGVVHGSLRADEFKPIEKTLNWLGDYGEALRTAVAAQRPVWIQFTGPWCPNCHKMDRETFRNPRVIEQLSKHFVTAKISCENDAELALSFGFTQLPSSVLISPDGKILARHEGFADPEKLAALTAAAGVTADSPVGEEKTELAATEPNETIISADLVSKPTGHERETFEVAMLEPIDHSVPRLTLGSDDLPGDEAGKLLAEEKSPPERASGELDPATQQSEALLPLGRYCPVTLVEKAVLVVADGSRTAVYAGSRYYFETDEAKAKFASSPEKYVPARGGDCLVALAESGQEVAGSEQFPVVYDGRIYLCASERSRQKFLARPAAYSGNDIRMSGKCPHCGSPIANHGQERKPFQIRFGGSRYQFPDKAHMEAFLKAPLRYLR